MTVERRQKEDIQSLYEIVAAHNEKSETVDAHLMDEIAEIKNRHTVDLAEIAKFQSTINYVLFGNKELKEPGMKEKVDEIHALLVQARNVGGFFTGIKALAGWLLVIGALVALFKGWLGALLAWVMIK